MIGLAAVLMMATTGRIAGVSGFVSRLLPPYEDNQLLVRLGFVAGLVAAPQAAALADAFRYLREHPQEGREWGRAGRAVAERVTWDGAISRLLS